MAHNCAETDALLIRTGPGDDQARQRLVSSGLSPRGTLIREEGIDERSFNVRHIRALERFRGLMDEQGREERT